MVVLSFLIVHRIEVGLKGVFKLTIQAKISSYCNLEDASDNARIGGVALSGLFYPREDFC